jgi:hypothetical protein
MDEGVKVGSLIPHSTYNAHLPSVNTNTKPREERQNEKKRVQKELKISISSSSARAKLVSPFRSQTWSIFEVYEYTFFT